jgi:hypothetical protein
MQSYRFLLIVTCLLLPETVEAHRQYAPQHRRFMQRDLVGTALWLDQSVAVTRTLRLLTDDGAKVITSARDQVEIRVQVGAPARIPSNVFHPRRASLLGYTPSQYVDGMSLYNYVASGPLGRTDPDGLLAAVSTPARNGKECRGDCTMKQLPGGGWQCTGGYSCRCKTVLNSLAYCSSFDCDLNACQLFLMPNGTYNCTCNY